MKNNYSRFAIIALITLIVFLYALTLQAHAAGLPAAFQQTVTGVVTDEAGNPLPGVSVVVKGTNKGTATNVDGEYQIEAGPQAVLVFSYMGFERVEIPVEGRPEIIVQLKEDINALEEVQINAGYYNTTRRESTGSISRVTAEEIEMQPVINPLQALQGRMAGIQIIPSGSQPGAAYTIRIRGRNSLRDEGNYPLYIIDGVPVNSAPIESNSMFASAGIDPLNNLNLNNIKSIEVLKDAGATAIYGSRGANGVVLITTKSGNMREAGLEVSFYTGVATVPNRVDLLNTQEYLEVRRRAFENDGVEPDEYNAYDLLLWSQDSYTDWQDFFFGGTAETSDVNLAISGGSENTFFRVGGSFHQKGTVYPGDYDYQKMTGSISLEHSSVDEKFRLSLNANYGIDMNNLLGTMDLASYAFILPPNAPSVFNEEGELNWEDWSEAGLDNPLSGYHNDGRIVGNGLVANLGLGYNLFEDLIFRTSLGYTHYNSEELLKLPKRSYNPSYVRPNASSHLSVERKSWIVEPQLIYETAWENLDLEAIFGATFQENEVSRLGLTGRGYVSEAVIGNLDAAEEVINASSQSTDYRYTALFGRLGVDLNEKYYLNLTGRRDGSSRFGPNNRFASFGAVGVAWIFTEEPFVEKTFPFLSFGKLRGSYGTTGNDQIGDYGYINAYEATDGPGGLYPTGLANPDYSWEVNKKMEAAVELGLYEGRINMGISWYRNRSSNQLVGYPLPAITGFTIVQANLPAVVQNTGWELEFSSVNFSSENFQWETSFNLTLPENELISYPRIDQSSYANTYRVGHPLNISLRYRYEGIDPETGFYTFTDVNQDSQFGFEDRVIIQDHGRKYFGGLNNNLRYQNFSLQFLWQFVKQEGFVGLLQAGIPYTQRSEVLQALEAGSRFQKISQSWESSTAYLYAENSNLFIEDASFLRLKTLAISYILPVEILQKVNADNGRIFLHGQNLLTLSPYPGLDPEMAYSGSSFASLRTITGGIEFNF